MKKAELKTIRNGLNSSWENLNHFELIVPSSIPSSDGSWIHPDSNPNLFDGLKLSENSNLNHYIININNLSKLKIICLCSKYSAFCVPPQSDFIRLVSSKWMLLGASPSSVIAILTNLLKNPHNKGKPWGDAKRFPQPQNKRNQNN